MKPIVKFLNTFSRILLFWYTMGWRSKLLLLAPFLVGVVAAWRMKKKTTGVMAAVLAAVVVLCEVLDRTALRHSYGAMIPLMIGGFALAMLAGMGIFCLARWIFHRLRKRGE